MPFHLTTKKRQLNDTDAAIKVFDPRRMDMCGGDRSKCWEWKGLVNGQPITKIGGTLFAVNRIVYGLRNGIPYDAVPRLCWLCNNEKCCNPDHIIPKIERKKHDRAG